MTPSLRHLLQGALWQLSSTWKPPLRALRRQVSLLLYRLRRTRHPGGLPPRVHGRPRQRLTPPIAHPAIVVLAPSDPDRTGQEALLASQTETSLTWEGSPETAHATFCWTLPADPAALSPTHMESLLLAAVAENLAVTIGAWSPPWAADRQAVLTRPSDDERAALELLRLPAQATDFQTEILARIVPHISEERSSRSEILTLPLAQVSGSYWLRGDIEPGTLVKSDIATDLDEILRHLPVIDGPRTVLFLLPFLAVGGAERLLFDLLAGLGPGERVLIVTTEPHQAALGQTLDRARRLTPYVYTLGDWLPRESHGGVLRHLIRRYRVTTLFSWNGTTLFYDMVPELEKRFPELYMLNQLYNHRGGWIEHYTPRLRRAVDRHVAVNRRIAEALAERGVPEERIAVVHHGVEIPPIASPAERARNRAASRRFLGLPATELVVGSFMRLHPQKRPFDILNLARRLAGQGVHFLLAGGGPLDQALDRELAKRPIPHLTRLPMTRDVAPLYDAIDLCLLTSAYEGLPVFLLDGLARALPCVATAVGEIPELLNEGGGVLIERPGDLAALERGVLELRDGEHRARQGALGRRTVEERFGLERYRRSYAELLFQHRADGGQGSKSTRGPIPS